MVVGVLRHEAGHKEEAELVLPADVSGGKNPVQAVGSSLSYGQRYVTKLLLNLASRRLGEDDDGQIGWRDPGRAGRHRRDQRARDRSGVPRLEARQPQTAGELAPASFQRVIGCYNTRLARVRAQGAAAA